MSGMVDDLPQFKDEDPIQFSFATYGELKRVFGPVRAAVLIKTREKKLAQGSAGASLTKADIETALNFLRGEKTGAQSSRALKAFRHYFGTNERARRACESYLEKLESSASPSERLPSRDA